MRCFVAQNASPQLLAYWLGCDLDEVTANPVWAVDEAAPLLYHLLNRKGFTIPQSINNWPQAEASE